MECTTTETRPDWFDVEQFPFDSHYEEIDGSVVHYVDEGAGTPLLMLHGQPTWSFLYRDMIAGLRDTFRCIAPDYPGFGLSKAAPGYGYTVAEHSSTIEALVDSLQLEDIVLVGQDWGGPIGLGVATRRPDRFQGFILGNTWAWPPDRRMRSFSKLMGKGWSGRILTQWLNVFVNVFTKRGRRRRQVSDAEMKMWRGPFPTVESRLHLSVFPREIITAIPFLTEVEERLPEIADRPALLLLADEDMAFGRRELKRWESIFVNHKTHVLEGAGHYWQDDAGEEAVQVIYDWWSSLQD